MQNNRLNSELLTDSANERPALVLVVDDEEQNRMLLRDPLEARGYEVIEAENGMEALQKVGERLPDVILLDVMMPKMDGFEVCRRLRTFWKTAPIPVLMVTALSERKERLTGIEAGATDFLTKPIDLQEVCVRIANAVSTKRLFDRLRAEQERSERLLLNILPKPIIERIKAGEETIADNIPEATVLFADLVGFTTLSTHVCPEQVVCLLNEIFSAFDALAEKRGLEKVKTVGDGYLVVGGAPLPREDHAEAIAELALEMRSEIERLNRAYETSIQIRIGISTGTLVAGVIGKNKFAYDIWGSAVNLAGRLASSGDSGGIQVAEPAFEKMAASYQFTEARKMEVRGCGEVVVRTLTGRIDFASARNIGKFSDTGILAAG